MPRLAPLGALLAAAAAVAVVLLPFVVLKSNRILPGDPRGLLDVLPAWGALGCQAILLCAAIAALGVSSARVRLGAALLGVAAVALAVAAAGDALTPAGNKVVRVAPGAGVWVLLVCLGLLATDAITRMRPGPGRRVLLLAVFSALAGLALAHGTFDHLSVMREYAVNADRFAREARQHLWLALGSLAAAVVVALPIGILCHRVPRLRAGVLGTLNVIQTIPSIALFLYSLLPIAANTVAGLKRVPRAAVEAARGMGMTNWQVLTGVELVLALPVILTGIRIVLVQNIGMVTIAALIGGGGLGTFVFQGIGQTAIDLVLLGAIPIVALAFSAAVVLDALVELMDRARQ
ncbi:MAG: ABC transporter permease [Gammaproteobacteria bacterium]|nr:MAG: ABC transporter permease [Gammaproteobacteria bacterium]